MFRVVLLAAVSMLSPVLAQSPPPPSTETALPPAPKPLKRTMPEYPVGAFNQGISGEAMVEVVIRDNGKVDTARILREMPMDLGFGESARLSVKDWLFPKGQAGAYRVKVRFVPAPDDLLPEELAMEQAGSVVRRVNPKFPREAERRGVQGEASVVVVVDAEGRVTRSRIISEAPIAMGFGQSSLDAVSRWTFQPGAPGFQTVTVRFLFEGVKTRDLAVKIDELVLAPARSRGAEPVYPPAALANGIEGDVAIAVYIERGKVTNATVIGERPTDQSFAEAAFKAVIDWRYTGTPDGAYRVNVAFRLAE